MARKSKLATPEWILEGHSSKEEYERSKGIKIEEKKKGKTFKIRKCPDCDSGRVGVVLGAEEGKGKGIWECNDCPWQGKDVVEKELNEDEFMKYLDEKGEEVI